MGGWPQPIILGLMERLIVCLSPWNWCVHTDAFFWGAETRPPHDPLPRKKIFPFPRCRSNVSKVEKGLVTEQGPKPSPDPWDGAAAPGRGRPLYR